MTRTDYEQSVANKLGIISALKDNVGDEFTALEISAAMIDPPDLKPLQISAVLKSMVAEGLVSKRPSKKHERLSADQESPVLDSAALRLAGRGRHGHAARERR